MKQKAKKQLSRKAKKARVEILNDGTIVGWCKELRRLGIECQFKNRDCKDCFCG